MPFCKQCGNPVTEGQAFCGKCGAAQNVENPVPGGVPAKPFPIRFVRGIPFALVFVAFFFPLIVVSCPDTQTEVARYSTYETLDLARSAGKLFDYMNLSQFAESEDLANPAEMAEMKESLSKFTVLCVILLLVSAAAFGTSFWKGKVSACFGIAGAVLFTVILLELSAGDGGAAVVISPGYGFYTGIVFYLAGIVLNLLPDKTAGG